MSNPTEQAVLLGQFGDWGAYTANPGGKKVCFALSKPTSAATDPPGRNRDPAYIFVSTRPAEKVRNEVSIIVGYPLKPGLRRHRGCRLDQLRLYTQNDGAWVKNAAEETQMVDAMRKGAELVIKHDPARHQDHRHLLAQGHLPGARPGRGGVQIGLRPPILPSGFRQTADLTA